MNIDSFIKQSLIETGIFSKFNEGIELVERTTKKIKSDTYTAYREIESLLRSDNWRLIDTKNGEYEFLKLDEAQTHLLEVHPQLDRKKDELLKKVQLLIAKKKKLYSKMDITSPKSSDEKKLDKEIADLFSQINQIIIQKRKMKTEINEGKFADIVKKAEVAHSKGNRKLAKYHLDNARTFMLGLKSTEVGKNKEFINKYNEMRKQYNESLSEGIWPKSKLKSDRFEFELSSELKKNFKGIFYVIGHDLYHNDKKVMTIDGDRDSINSIIKKLKSKVRESVNESNNTPMMSKSGKNIFVDTTFVQLSNKFGRLEHLWMGDFVVKTKEGDVEFSRVNKKIDGFSGRTHQVSGNPKAITSLIKNMKPKVVKESVNEKNIPKKGTSDYHQHKIAVDTMKNPNKSMMGGPSPKEAEQILMKKFGYSKKEIDKLNESVNERYTGNSGDKLTHKHDKNIEIELIEPTNKGWKVYQTDKGRKRKIAYFDKQDIVGNKALFESVNEASRRATDFYGDSKHGKALHSLLKGKWDSKKVEKFLDKLGGGNDVKYARLIDFISGDAGLNIRKYKTIGEQLPELMKVLKTLYTDFLTEAVNERTTKTIKAGTYKGSKEIETLLRSGKWKLIGRNGDEYELMMIEGLTEATITSIPQFNLESDAYIAMLNMLKNNSKFKKIIGTSLLAYMSGGNPKNILTSLRGMLARAVVTDKLINGTVAVLNKRTPRISVSSQQASTPKIIDQFSGVLAAGLLFDFREDPIGMAKLSGDKNVINTANDFSANRGKEKFKTMMRNKLESISESKKINWDDFYTRAKDTSGYDPSFEKKYGRLLDLPHIKDALNKTSDFKSFMKFISKFESVVDADGMQRAGVALPQTEEEPIEESTTEPKIITQLRDVMKSGYKKLKDPKSGKVMTVDSYSASAIVKVYDALNTVNKEKFANAGLLGMQSMAFKLIK